MENINYKKCGIVAGISIFILIIFLLTLKSCSIQKKVSKPGTLGEVITESENNLDSRNSFDSENIQQTESVVSTEIETEEETVKETTSSNKNNSGNKSNSEGSENPNLNNSEMSIKSVENFEVVSKYNTNALVSSKNVYLLNDSVYAYSLKLLIPISGDYKTIEYMCSVASWNQVEENDSLNIEYGVDKEGKIAILSLSK